MKGKGRWLIILATAIVLVNLHAMLFVSYLGRRFEPTILDFWFKLRGALPPPAEVAVIALDDETYDRLNASPLQFWPRKYHVEFLKKLAKFGVKGVVFDIVFDKPGLDQEVDKELGSALSLVPSVLGLDVTRPSHPGDEEEIEEVGPIDNFKKAARGIGSIIIPEDENAIKRTFPVSLDAIPGKHILSLAQAGGMLYSSKVQTPSQRDFINYYGPPHSITTIPYYRILKEDSPDLAHELNGKVVFVGYALPIGAAAAGKDIFFTPFMKGGTFGVEIHATAAANLISGNWIRRLGKGEEILALSAFVFVVLLLLLSLSPYYSGLTLIAVCALWAIASYQAFLRGFFLPGLIANVLVFPVAFLISLFYFYALVYRRQHAIREAFSRYLTPEMVDRIAEEPEHLKLGGKLVEAAIFFSDIASFTSLSEHAAPEEVSRSLNRYFTEIANIAMDQGGTLIKFIGDGMFALWGAPLAVQNSATRAASTALLIQKRLLELAKKQVLPFSETRIGIHYGLALVGNLGSEKRFDYTAVGDAVNVASRLEQLNKHFGTSILISQNIKDKLSPEFNCLRLGMVKVCGKEEALPVYSLRLEPLTPQIEDLWLKGLELFAKKEWGQSECSFEEVLRLIPELKKIAALYLREIQLHKGLSPQADWKGELSFDIK